MKIVEREIKDTKGCDERRHVSCLTSPVVSRLTSHAPAPWPKATASVRCPKKLEEICLFIADCPHSTAPDEGHGFPLVRTPNIGNGRLIFEKMHRVSRAVYEARNKRAKPQAGDLIYAREAPAGNVALITKGQEVCLGQRTVLLRPNPTMADSAFLTYYLLAPEQRHRLLGTATGATVTHVNLPAIRNLEVALPPLPVQRRIADILSAYDDLIENNRRRIAILEETARLTYRKWFGGSEQCRTATIGKIAPFVRGKVITQKNAAYGKVPVVAGGLDPAYFHNVANTGAPVITISGSGANAGFTRMYFEPIWASDCSWCDKSKTKCFYFAYCFLKDNADALRNLQQGAAQPHVYPKDINALEIVLPKSNDMLDNFEATVEPLFSQCGVLAKQNASLAAARNMLLPRLMKGFNS